MARLDAVARTGADGARGAAGPAAAAARPLRPYRHCDPRVLPLLAIDGGSADLGREQPRTRVHRHLVGARDCAVSRPVAAGAREPAGQAAPRGSAGMSSTLSRYVMRAVLGTTLLVMLVLLTLSGLYIFIT